MPWYRIGSGFRQRFVFIDTIGTNALIGIVFTKHLKPLEGEIIPIGERHKTEKTQPEPVENESVGG